MTDQELLQAIREITREEVRAITREEIQESEIRMKGEIQESEKRMKGEIQESRKQIMQDAAALMDAEFIPKFNLLADEISIVREKVENLEKKVERIEDTLLEHEFKLRIIK